MKLNAEKAAFSFNRYIIRKVSFLEPIENQSAVSIEFDASGEYDVSTKTYRVDLRFYAKYGEKNDKILIDLTAEGYFIFENEISLEEIPEYFYPNSMAILFPYLRAFVTTITAVGNAKPFILPTFNLSTLTQPLRDNTKLK